MLFHQEVIYRLGVLTRNHVFQKQEIHMNNSDSISPQ